MLKYKHIEIVLVWISFLKQKIDISHGIVKARDLVKIDVNA